MEGLEKWVNFCLSFSDSYQDYPFGEGWIVFRHRKNQKLFAMFYERMGKLCVNLKCDPLRADFLRRALPWVTPGYHMNKTHWNTVWLDQADWDETCSMILHSYLLTAGKPVFKGERYER